MKSIKNIIFSIILLLQFHLGYAQDYHVRIAFIGNSITIGTGLSSPATQCYPSQLASLLQENYGDTCIIGNFAVSGRTMLKRGDYPIWNEIQFENALNFAPNICFIMLGTNDSKPQNWDAHGDEFLSDYQSMIDTFTRRNPYIKFIVTYPPPAYAVVWGIRDSVILNSVIPFVDSMVNRNNAKLIDFYHPLLDSVYLFPDKIHPNAAGAGVIARMIRDTMLSTDLVHKVETGLTFVTSFKTSNEEISTKDTAILSWTTVNADTVYLDGQIVPTEGSLMVTPDVTTTYTLIAKGKISTDSMKLEQLVYQSYLAMLVVQPNRPKILQGDSIRLHALFYDQKNKMISDTIYNVVWSISEGDGYVSNETDTAITFIAGNPGTAKLLAEVDSISGRATITIEASTWIGTNVQPDGIEIYPVPFTDRLNFKILDPDIFKCCVILYDMQGRQIKKVQESFIKNTQHLIEINTENLTPAMYYYRIKYQNYCFNGMVVKCE